MYSAEQPTSIMFSRNIFSQLVLVMNITGMDAEETTQKDRKIPKLEFLGPKVGLCLTLWKTYRQNSKSIVIF